MSLARDEPLLSSPQVWTALAEGGQRTVDRQVARTIASWWMAPHTALSELAHVGRVDRRRLLDEIAECASTEIEPPEVDELAALRAWVCAQPWWAAAAAQASDSVANSSE